MSRIDDLNSFYRLLAELESKIGGKWRLSDCGRKEPRKESGILFFFEEGENRTTNPSCQRVVHVGWSGNLNRRLNAEIKGGNQEAAVLRKHIGRALINRKKLSRLQESDLKSQINIYLKEKMSMLFVFVPDEKINFIKRNAITLLSNYYNLSPDKPSHEWLGRCSVSKKGHICKSGLWNVQHVTASPDPAFLPQFAALVRQMQSPPL